MKQLREYLIGKIDINLRKKHYLCTRKLEFEENGIVLRVYSCMDGREKKQPNS
jgi:hypothetical protein